jgi:hypothetical protein
VVRRQVGPLGGLQRACQAVRWAVRSDTSPHAPVSKAGLDYLTEPDYLTVGSARDTLGFVFGAASWYKPKTASE